MKKSSRLFLCVIGLALITADPIFAQGGNLHLRSWPATQATPGGQAGPADLSNGSVGGSYLATAANNQAHGTTTHTSQAILAGVLLLMLLQRRYRNEITLKSKP